MIGRLITAAVGIPVLAAVVWVGGPVFTVVVAGVAAIGAVEVCEMARAKGLPSSRVAAAILAALLVASHYLFATQWETPEYLPLLAVSIVLTAVALILIFPLGGHLRVRGIGVTLGAIVYPGALLAHAPLLRGSDQGLEWVVLLLAVTFSTDTAAYLVGKAIGKHPLAPTISPNKTWEGAIAGFHTALIAVLIAAWALEIEALGVEGNLSHIFLLGALMGVAGQAGDLFESKLKRLADAKESGWILPGHGGVLDRLDSIVFNLALVYYFVIGGVL